jgi:DNA repair protein RadC
MEQLGVRALADVELLTLLLGPTAGINATSEAANSWARCRWPRWHGCGEEIQLFVGVGPAIAAAFELGRREGWAPPKRGDRVLQPARVYYLLRGA